MCSAQMRAARYHGDGGPFTIDTVERPSPRPADVLVEVKACGMVPNFINALNLVPPSMSPPLPAIYGLDAAGVIAAKGAQVHGLDVGEQGLR